LERFNEKIKDKYYKKVYITYKKLCELLNEPYKNGNAKKAQLKEWLRYFDYEKIDNKFLILDVYNEPLEKEYQYPANAIYIKYIEVLLLSLLASTEGNMVTIAPQSLYKTFGMINDNFTRMQRLEPDERLKELQKVHSYMTEFEIDNFFERCKSKFSKVIKGAFSSLQKRMLIKFSEEYEYYVLEKESLFDMRPNPKMTVRKYIADAYDIEYILKVKRETLLKYGCEEESQIYLKKKTLPYYNEINKRVKEERNWVGLYKVYVINYCRDTSIEALEKDQITLQKYGLNEALIKYIDEQAVKNYDKTKDISKDGEEFRYPDSYIHMQHLLSDKLLRIEQKRDKEDNKTDTKETDEWLNKI
jgi:hypothetical protein